MSTNRKTIKQNYRIKGTKPTPLSPCPVYDVIRVVQFQFFDNGAKPGRGKYQHALSVEVHCTDKLDLRSPDWKLAVGLSEPDAVLKWAEEQFAANSITADQLEVYRDAASSASGLRDDHGENLDWVKIGRMRDKRTRTEFAGDLIIAWRLKTGHMECVMNIRGGALHCPRFIRDKFSKPGTARRRAYGFYDPTHLYYRQKAIAEWEATEGALGSVAEITESMLQAARIGEPWSRARLIEQRIDQRIDQPK